VTVVQAIMHKRFLRDAEARALYCSVRQIASGDALIWL